MTERSYRSTQGGYFYMGGIQIPPMPRHIILTDRADGTKWWLTYNLSPATSDGFGYISITTTMPPTSQESITFAAYEEPVIAFTSGNARLIVNGGYLGVEERNPSQGVTDRENMQIYARIDGLNNPMRRIIFSVATPGQYAWVPYTYVQTPNPV